MDTSDLDRVARLQGGRLNGGRVNRLAREMYCSATDPGSVVREARFVLGLALALMAAFFALITSMLDA